MKITKKSLFALVSASLLLTACSDDDESYKLLSSYDESAVINTVASNYSDSDIELVDFSEAKVGEDLQADQAGFSLGLSDFDVASYGSKFYRIGRFNIDTVSQYDISAPSSAAYTYSTLDNSEDPSSNPQDLIFTSENKAYLLRSNSTKLWIVNPSAATEEDFKIGEIDLSAYNTGDDTDGKVEMSSGVIVDGKLYVTLQRLSSFCPQQAFVVVIDTATDTEIDTDTHATLKGIPMITKNPMKIVHQQNIGLLIASLGSYSCGPDSSPEYLGGIEVIDTTDYSTTLLVDDGTTQSHPYGQMNNIAVISDSIGYFIGYNAWKDTALYKFDPSTGIVAEGTVANLGGGDTTFDIRSINVGAENTLWVSIADDSNPRVAIIDTRNDSIAFNIETLYNPTKVVFAK